MYDRGYIKSTCLTGDGQVTGMAGEHVLQGWTRLINIKSIRELHVSQIGGQNDHLLLLSTCKHVVDCL